MNELVAVGLLTLCYPLLEHFGYSHTGRANGGVLEICTASTNVLWLHALGETDNLSSSNERQVEVAAQETEQAEKAVFANLLRCARIG